jgi:hypothetical protein
MANEWEQQRFKRNIIKLLEVAENVLIDKLDPLEGVFLMVEIYYSFPEAERIRLENLFLGLRGIESQADHLPKGASRKYWDREALMKKDIEKNEISIFFKDQIKVICRKLIKEIKATHI